ncbi:MAG: HIT domain-containing protein [Legionellaceae bacterium]
MVNINVGEDNFHLDERLQSSTFFLIDWPLSRVLLKNNAFYPWFVLVPRTSNLTELTQLSQGARYQLMDEVQQVSLVVQDIFKPSKLNVGTLGNIVHQFHMHVVARFFDDPLWPEGIWQSATPEKAYEEPEILISRLIDKLSEVAF